MNKRSLFVPALALSILFGGCASAGPNAQQGAVAGGALGAIAGAIIGNNSGSHNGASGAAIGAAIGAIAGGTLGDAKDKEQAEARRYQNEPPYQPPQPTYTKVSSLPRTPKPPASMPPEEIPASPNPEAIWIPGYWDYNGASYVWMPGRWEVPPPAKTTYVAAHWETRMGNNVFVRGYWE